MLALRDIREWVAGFGISEDSRVYIGTGGYVCTGGGGILWPVGDHGEEVYGNFRGHGKGVRF